MPIEESMSEKTPSIPSERSSVRSRRMKELFVENRRREEDALARTGQYYNGLTRDELQAYANAKDVSIDEANKLLARRLRERKEPSVGLELIREDALDIVKRAKDKKAKSGAKAV
jgi:hypothetical protein